MLDTNTHHHTITEPIFLFSNGAGPLRMTTSPLRISGHSHKAMRQGRGASRPPTPSAFHPTSVKCRYTLLRVSPLSLFISLSCICILCVPLPLSPFLQGIKSNLSLFFKDIVKAIQQGKKVHFLPEDIFYHLNLILTEFILLCGDFC